MPHRKQSDNQAFKPLQSSTPTSKTRATVEELLRMVSGGGGTRSAGSGPSFLAKQTHQPPPLPPKPRPKGYNHESNSDSVDYVPDGSDMNKNARMHSSNGATSGDGVDSFTFVKKKFDAYHSGIQHDNDNHNDSSDSRMQPPPLSSSTFIDSTSAKYSQKIHQQQSSIDPKHNKYYGFIDGSSKSKRLTQSPLITMTNANDDYDTALYTNNRDDAHISGPIVTESPEEANNNKSSTYKTSKAINSTSTVKILEVPFERVKPRGKNTTIITYGNDDSNNTTFSRTQRLFHDNNSYATPVVTVVTDDEDGDEQIEGVDVEASPIEIEVETILNESASEYPPRTSTPNSIDSNTDIKDANEDDEYIDNRTRRETVGHGKKATVITCDKLGADLKACSEEAENLGNVSKDTDDAANISALNSSGCGEIVGINDSFDIVYKSKESPRSNNSQDKMQYTYKDLSSRSNKSNMSTQRNSSPSSFIKTDNGAIGKQSEQNKLNDLQTLTSSLLKYTDSMKSQIESLTKRVGELESQVKIQKETIKVLEDENNNRKVPHGVVSSNIRRPLSSTGMNAPIVSNQANGAYSEQDLDFNSNRNYSRDHIATITRSAQQTPRQGSATISKKLGSSQPLGSTTSRPLRKTNAHASTNSLYADSFKSTSTSISPMPFNQLNRLSSSPSTSMGDLTNKRANPSAYTSLVSLCPSSHYAASTLRREAGMFESVSNLSQSDNQLTNFPSMSDFVLKKQKAKEILYLEEERSLRMALYNRLIAMYLPTWVGSDYNLDKVIEPPAVKLKLDWVHGYRGRDCRTNIFYLPTGECVYFVASIVVLYNPEERTQRHYLGHTESVKCLAVHPNKLIIASGQSSVLNRKDKRPIVRVWNTVSLATLRVIGFNEDFDRSICCLSFSKHDQGATLAVVDESNEHTITLLDWQREKNWRLAETNSGHEPVLAIDFHPIDKYSLVAVGKSTVNFWDVRGMTMTKKAGLFDKYDKPKYVLCLTFNDFGDTITGDSNGNIILWPRGMNRPSKIVHNAHAGGVFSVLAMKDGSYLTGGRDRRIIEWDDNFERTGREAELPEHCGGVRHMTYAKGMQVLIGTLRNCILIGSMDKNFSLLVQGHTIASSTLAIHPLNSQYLTGGFDDQIHLFDSKTHELIWTKCLMMPITAASFSPNGKILIIGSTQGKWLVLDAMSNEILFTKCEGTGTISCVKFSPDGGYFSMGSSDFQIYVYQASEDGSKFCSVGVCSAHTAPVKEIDWTLDGRYFQSQSLNFELLFWKASVCRQIEEQDTIEGFTWQTHNCTLGFHTIGLWSDPTDSALINHCDKSNDEKLLASVSETGNINLYKWPPCTDQSQSQKYYGNVDRFDLVKFLNDDLRLVAIGARDCVTTEWIVERRDDP